MNNALLKLRTIGKGILFTIIVMSFSSFTSTTNGTVDWERLGSKVVNYKLDRDVIKVGAHEGTFKKLKLKVTGGTLNMRRMIVQYNNGTKDKIDLRFNFKGGSRSRIIDLKGYNRVIKDITFIYDTKNNSRRRAKIHVFGR